MNIRDVDKRIIVVLLAVTVLFLVVVLPISLLKSSKERITRGFISNVTLSPSVELKEPNFVKTYPNVTLENLWAAYREKIQKDGRTIDRSRNYLTTSEGQSYSLLRAVWMDDKDTFDRVLKWTQNNLQKRKGDELFAWKWGETEYGVWDVLVNEGGMNTASDADVDIALALIFASKRWNQPNYAELALPIIKDIWRIEVLQVKEKYVLLPGNWAKSESLPTINPSYFSPAHYVVFAEIDKEHPWLELRDHTYDLLDEMAKVNFGSNSNVGLPPDWAGINLATAQILPALHSDKTTDFSDDAFRTIWRVALDWEWYKNPRAKQYLESLSFLSKEWESKGKIFARYTVNGVPSADYESNSMYGGIMPYFKIVNPSLAQQIYNKKLVSLYNPDTEDFATDIGYYAQNWVWFGMAFYEGKLINLFEVL